MPQQIRGGRIGEREDERGGEGKDSTVKDGRQGIVLIHLTALHPFSLWRFVVVVVNA